MFDEEVLKGIQSVDQNTHFVNRELAYVK